MISRFGISFIVLLHTLGTLIYFLRMSNDPTGKYWHDYSWTVFFDTVMVLPMCLISFLFAFMKQRSMFDKELLIVEGIFTILLASAFNLQNFGYISHTYGLQLAIAGIIATTIFIMINGYKGGYYNNFTDGNGQ